MFGKFPPAAIDWAHLISLIGPANAALARQLRSILGKQKVEVAAVRA